MNTIDLKLSVQTIKECEELKSRIDKLVGFGNELSISPLGAVYEFKVKRPEKVKTESDTYGESPLMGLLSWNIRAATDNDESSYFAESLSVQESFMVVNVLVQLNREKLRAKIDQLKEMGVSI